MLYCVLKLDVKYDFFRMVQDRIPYVDYHSVLKDENNALPAKHAGDGVYPNQACYEIMEEIVLRAL